MRKAARLNLISLLFRRFKQFGQILFSHDFRWEGSIEQRLISHYSTPAEVEYYDRWVSHGLTEGESEAFEAFLKGANGNKLRGLIVGCGVGREAQVFAGSGVFKQIDAIDTSLNMIKRARLKNRFNCVHFFQCDIFKINNQYDFIWVSPTIESHIQGSQNRIQFFRQLRKLCHPRTMLILTPLIRPMHWRHHYFWGSQLLRLRWIGQNKWEPGDVPMANLSSHHVPDKLVFYHYYPNEEALESELTEARWNTSAKLPQSSWLLKPRDI